MANRQLNLTGRSQQKNVLSSMQPYLTMLAPLAKNEILLKFSDPSNSAFSSSEVMRAEKESQGHIVQLVGQ